MANHSFMWHWGNSFCSQRQGFVAGRTKRSPIIVSWLLISVRVSQGGTQHLSLLAENRAVLDFVCSFVLGREDLPPGLKCLWCLLLFPPVVLQQKHSSVPSLCSVVWAQAVSSWRAWIFCLVLSRYRWNTDFFFFHRAWKKYPVIKATVFSASFSYKVYQLQQQAPDN